VITRLARWMPLAAVLLCASTASAQGDSVESRSVSGRVLLGKRAGPQPVPGIWIALHRVDTRRGAKAGESGPIDSMRTTAAGGYAFRYRATVHDNVIYFVMPTYSGIAYPNPLRARDIAGADGDIVVFDTTSAPYPITVAGRHLIVFGPRDGDSRTIGEVFELSNDSTMTVVGEPQRPTWSVAVPPGLSGIQVDPNGEVSQSAVAHRSDRVDVYAALSPGVRQLSFSYALPNDRFPLSLPLEGETAQLEVLVQEPRAHVTGAGLREVAPVPLQGAMFRRFLADHVPANAVVKVTVPASASGTPTMIPILLTVLAAAMVLALALALKRQPLAPVRRVDPLDEVLRQLATREARRERAGDAAGPALGDAESAAMRKRAAALLAGAEQPE
jgi:hypothetical protein